MTESGDRSIASVLQSIVGNIEHIVRSEIRLAKAEIRDEADKAGQASKILGVGIVLGAFSIGLFLLCCVYLLSMLVAAWMATLIVGLVIGVVSIALISSGMKQLKSVNPTPEKTLNSIKENAEWAKAQIK